MSEQHLRALLEAERFEHRQTRQALRSARLEAANSTEQLTRASAEVRRFEDARSASAHAVREPSEADYRVDALEALAQEMLEALRCLVAYGSLLPLIDAGLGESFARDPAWAKARAAIAKATGEGGAS